MLLAIAFVQIILSLQEATADAQVEEKLLGEVGESVLLPCYHDSINVSPSAIQWNKNGIVVARYNISSGHAVGEHFSILDNGNVNISGLLASDEGTYECIPWPLDPLAKTQKTFLQITRGPVIVKLSVEPATVLANGTLYAMKGSEVSFNCSSSSYPSQNLSWIFEDSTHKNVLASGTGSSLELKIPNIHPDFQGNFTCHSENGLSEKKANGTMELLVYNRPESRHPECMWSTGNDSSSCVFSCIWSGGYPSPTLNWQYDKVDGKSGISGVGDTLKLTLNRTLLYNGQTLKCTGSHIDPSSEEKFCSITLVEPFPMGEPLAVGLEGSNLTLTCRESSSIPVARTKWQKSVNQVDIVKSAKYVLSEQGPEFMLTIVNLTKDDEGIYFCRSESPLAVRELEIYVTVKNSAANAGGIIGLFISVVVVGIGIFLGITAYSNRDKICLGRGFSRLDESEGDVISLVESDEEEIFHDAVPRLPPVENGHVTTLVEIHSIPSSDHEDQDSAHQNQSHQEHMESEE